MPRQLAFVHHPFALFNQPHLLSRPYSTQLLGWDAVFVCVAKIRTSDSAGHHRHIRFILSMCLHHIPRVWRTFYLEIMCLKPHSRCAGSRFSCFDCRRVLCLLVCVCVCVCQGLKSASEEDEQNAGGDEITCGRPSAVMRTTPFCFLPPPLIL